MICVGLSDFEILRKVLSQFFNILMHGKKSHNSRATLTICLDKRYHGMYGWYTLCCHEMQARVVAAVYAWRLGKCYD